MRDRSRPAESPPPALDAMLRAADGILDLLPVATFICDARGVIAQFNQRAVELWGRTPKPGQTHADFTSGTRFRDAAGEPVTWPLLQEVLARGQPVRNVERLVERADGVRMTTSANVDPLLDDAGGVIGAVFCIQDITDLKAANEALTRSRRHAREQEQRLAATYEHAAIGISEIDPSGRILRVNEAICAITGFAREELLQSVLFRYTHPDDIDSDRDAFRRQVAGELDFYSIEKRFTRKDGRSIWMSVRSSPVRDADGRLLYMVRVVQDVSERKAAERRQKLLVDELDHRVKNTLATVQSLAAQTARTAPTPERFRESFEGRLMALSKAHDQLTQHHWESADLRALLSAAFAPYEAGPQRVVLRGVNVMLRPRAVVTLAMAFHELITNAAKYGALSTPEGRIEVSWQPAGGDVLRIDWQEHGGPPVDPPQRRGFGSRLIEGGTPAELGGRVQLTFAPDGLRCEFLIPLERAVVDTSRPPEPEAEWSI